VPETWESSDYFRVTLEDLTEGIAEWVSQADGITISGGEPFDQPDALFALLRWFEECRRPSQDVLVYSGYPAQRIHRQFGANTGAIDALISEPFVANMPDDRAFVGSRNQRFDLLTALGRARYADMSTFDRAIGVDVRDGIVLLAGVAARGDLSKLAEAMAADGSFGATELTHDAV
jgi:anaerobic ribonucleoside-triphosphate reductase activating protein